MELAIRTRGLGRTHYQRGREPLAALSSFDLDIPAGSWTAILGPNGSGKSTLLRSLAGMEVPDAGSIELFGEPARRFGRTLRARLGVVFQAPSLDPLLTIRENLSLQARACAVRHAPARIQSLAESLGIHDRLADRVGTLSGGLARRADLARALIHRPALLLLDEPTAGLDPRARAEFWALLSTIREAEPTTIVLATHLFDEAELADRVIFIDRGRIVADGEPRALRFAHGERVLRLDGDDPDLRSSLAEAGFRVLTGGAHGLHAAGGVLNPTLVEALGARGTGFEFGPATLGDVYLARTGHSLEAPEP